MCGIFGVVSNRHLSRQQLHKVTNKLFTLSTRRGKEAAGIALVGDRTLHVYKEPISARRFIREPRYLELFSSHLDVQKPAALIGHSRMVTNGSEEDQNNNQPVVRHDIVCIQNGIIVNEEELWRYVAPDTRKYVVDTETINCIVNKALSEGLSGPEALRTVFERIKGATSTAILTARHDVLLAGTNNGSLYSWSSDGLTIFASEENFLRIILNFIHTSVVPLTQRDIRHVRANEGFLVRLDDATCEHFSFKDLVKPSPTPARSELRSITVYPHTFKEKIYFNHLNQQADERLLSIDTTRINALRRCAKCLLPETFPFIQYDTQGVCNYCAHYKPLVYHGMDALRALADKNRKPNAEQDCIVPFSGGRDSSYALHVIKEELGLKPVVFTYDWGMITDLARRNISRMCGQLGIEHILISADIRKKRANIRLNVSAWLKRPHLGTVPLFMAGDKQFFYYANQLTKQFNTNFLLFGMNRLERTDFKVAFCGINELEDKNLSKHYNMSVAKKLRMVRFYAQEYLRNPSYINASLLDTLLGFFSYYLIPQDYYTFYEYVRWDENVVNNTIRSVYDWETDPTTKSTWRIGDGTASFYNYIYYRMAGFTENDTFRSNQIREGLISREDALREIQVENQPRFEAIKWYCDTIGIEFNAAIKAINSAGTRY